MSDVVSTGPSEPLSSGAISPGTMRIAALYAGALSLLPLMTVISAFALSTVPCIIGLIGWGALAFEQRRIPRPGKPVVAIALGIAAVSFLSALWAPATGMVFSRSLKTLPLLLGLVLSVTAAGTMPAQVLRHGLRLLPYAVMLGFIVMDIEQGFDMPLYRMLNGLQGAFVHPAVMNRAMICLTLFLFPALGAITMTSAGQRRRLLYAGLALCALPALVLTESQSTQVALLGGLLCFFIVPLRFRWVWKVLACAVVLYFISFPALALYAYQFQDAVNASPYFGHNGAFGGQRLEVWHGVAQKVMDRPWLGYGTEATRSMHFDFKKYFPTGTVLHPHNIALQVWIEFGVLGIAMICAALCYLLRVICVDLRGIVRRAALPTFMMSLLIGSTAYGMWQGWWIGVLILLASYFEMMRRADAAAPPA